QPFGWLRNCRSKDFVSLPGIASFMSGSQPTEDSAETTPHEPESLRNAPAPSVPKEIATAALASGFQDILGYLNFSGGKPDVKFQDRLNRCHPEWGWPNPWESFEAALLARLG